MVSLQRRAWRALHTIVARLSIKQESLALTAAVLAKLAEDQPMRQELPGGGRLRFDRRLPFVCVYRRTDDDDDDGTEAVARVGVGVADSAGERREARRSDAILLRAIVENLAGHFGSFLVLEIWAAEATSPKKAALEKWRGPARAEIRNRRARRIAHRGERSRRSPSRWASCG